jgi:hypothetical protein
MAPVNIGGFVFGGPLEGVPVAFPACGIAFVIAAEERAVGRPRYGIAHDFPAVQVKKTNPHLYEGIKALQQGHHPVLVPDYIHFEHPKNMTIN